MQEAGIGLAVIALMMGSTTALADTFGSGENAFEIPFVTIGEPGNAADTTGAPNPAGAVAYTYRIGKYEVPEEAIRKANAASAATGDPLGITLDDRGPQKPATGLSWFEAAQFVNWLNEDKGISPAYKLDGSGQFQLWGPGDTGYDSTNLFRNSFARYVLPSVDEWYKAAFYDPSIDDYWDFPTGSDSSPTPIESGTDLGTAVWNQTTGPADVMLAGGESPFGTVGQGGNVVERDETAGDLMNNDPNELRGTRGGSWIQSANAIALSADFRGNFLPTREPMNVGFRIVRVVPEPASGVALTLAITLLFSTCRRSPVACDEFRESHHRGRRFSPSN